MGREWLSNLVIRHPAAKAAASAVGSAAIVALVIIIIMATQLGRQRVGGGRGTRVSDVGEIYEVPPRVGGRKRPAQRSCQQPQQPPSLQCQGEQKGMAAVTVAPGATEPLVQRQLGGMEVQRHRRVVLRQLTSTCDTCGFSQ